MRVVALLSGVIPICFVSGMVRFLIFSLLMFSCSVDSRLLFSVRDTNLPVVARVIVMLRMVMVGMRLLLIHF
jgi:hypothetical protein